MKHNYAVNEFVNVYQKPISKEDFEGRAKIIGLMQTEHYYKVCFVDEPGEFYLRFIY